MHLNENLDTEEKGVEPVNSLQAEVIQNSETIDDNKLAKQIDPSVQKYLFITPVSQELKQKLNKTIADLESVKNDILKKKDELVDKKDKINQQIAALNDSKKIKIDKSEIGPMLDQSEKYTILLDSIVYELAYEVAYYKLFASDEKPDIEKIVVPINAPDSLEEYLEIQIMGIKKHLKNIKRDVAISFSRYIFGFEGQLRHLSYIESYLKIKETATTKT